MSADIASNLEKKYTGIGAAPGLAEAPIIRYCRQEIEIPHHCDCNFEAEKKRLSECRQVAYGELLGIKEELIKEGLKEEAAVFEAHAMIALDSGLTVKSDELLRQGWNAEVAWMEAIEYYAEQMACIPDPTLQARAVDIRDIGQRVLRILTGCNQIEHFKLSQISVIVAEDLTPSETACLDKKKVGAFCTAQGGPTSHTAILAKALGIPAIVGLGVEVLEEKDGTLALVDGSKGEMLVNPNQKERETFHERQKADRVLANEELLHACEPAISSDGHIVEIVANIGSLKDVQPALENGAEGVGLFRTEFLFLKRNVPPDEETQYQAYLQVLSAMGKRPVIIRTLDAGGDKDIPYLDRGKEANPFLGWRAIRICLDMPEMFNAQLRALLRAGTGHNLRIMFPMIATIEEVRQVRQRLDEAARQLKEEKVAAATDYQFGIMIEIPAAVVMADQLAKEVDFFSIGTNDLTQYSLAAERTNEKVARLSDPCHPAVLRQVKRVIEESHNAGIWTGVCGELAGDSDATPILLGMGLDEFSMSSYSIPHVKAVIRTWSTEDAKALATEALKQFTAAEVRALARAEIEQRLRRRQ